MDTQTTKIISEIRLSLRKWAKSLHFLLATSRPETIWQSTSDRKPAFCQMDYGEAGSLYREGYGYKGAIHVEAGKYTVYKVNGVDVSWAVYELLPPWEISLEEAENVRQVMVEVGIL